MVPSKHKDPAQSILQRLFHCSDLFNLCESNKDKARKNHPYFMALNEPNIVDIHHIMNGNPSLVRTSQVDHCTHGNRAGQFTYISHDNQIYQTYGEINRMASFQFQIIRIILSMKWVHTGKLQNQNHNKIMQSCPDLKRREHERKPQLVPTMEIGNQT